MPLAWLEQTRCRIAKTLAPDTETTILWAWQHRHALALTPERGLPCPFSNRPPCRPSGSVLSLLDRSSSLAESLHSWLRPHLEHAPWGAPVALALAATGLVLLPVQPRQALTTALRSNWMVLTYCADLDRGAQPYCVHHNPQRLVNRPNCFTSSDIARPIT